MLEALVGVVVGLLLLIGILVMVGPNLSGLVKGIRSLRRPTSVPSVFQSHRREAVPTGLNPKTQRVLVAAARLSNWLRTHGHDDLSREIRAAAARITSNEPVGLYALPAVLKKVRALNLDNTSQ